MTKAWCSNFNVCSKFPSSFITCFYCRHLFFYRQSFTVVQGIPTKGLASAVAFSGVNGAHLALDSDIDDAKIVHLGPFLSTEFIPLISGINGLPAWAVNEAVFRSGYGPSLIQRYMEDGSGDNLKQAAALMEKYPDASYTMNRLSGEGCYDTALRLRRPNLLTILFLKIVSGDIDADHDGTGTLLTSEITHRGANIILHMLLHHPPKFVTEILSKMSFVKVPFTEPRACSLSDPQVSLGSCSIILKCISYCNVRALLVLTIFCMGHWCQQECGSDSLADPWGTAQNPREVLKRSKKASAIEQSEVLGVEIFRTPAVLPLKGLGSLEFLSALLRSAPPEAFDNDAMGIVLRVMWYSHVQKYFLVDFFIFIIFFILWVLYTSWTSSSTYHSGPLHKQEWAAILIAALVLILNTLFALKEIFESNFFRNHRYFRNLWNYADLASSVFVYAYTISAAWNGVGSGNIPLAVISTLFLTLKLLSYLRGFGETGWLITVLTSNIADIRGFILMLFAIVVGFTVVFRLLFGDVEGECSLALGEYDELVEDCDRSSFGTLTTSLLSTFELVVVGEYDSALFDKSQYSVLAALVFCGCCDSCTCCCLKCPNCSTWR